MAVSAREIKYTITAENQAKDIAQEFFEQVKLGNKEIESATNAASEATRKYASEASALTKYIREQRTEQHEHNFIFRQSKEVLGAASIGLALFGNTVGATTPQMQRLTSSLNQGFIAFQGINNVVGLIKPLAGPWGIAIAAVGGLASSFALLRRESSDTIDKMLTDIKDLEVAAGRKTLEQRYHELGQELEQARQKHKELTKQITTETGFGATDIRGGREGEVITRYVGTAEERTKAYEDMLKIEAAMKRLQEQIDGANKKDNTGKAVPLPSVDDFMEQGFAAQKAEQMRHEAATAAAAHEARLWNQREASWQKWLETQSQLAGKEQAAMMQQYAELTSLFADSMQVMFTTAFEGSGNAAKAFFKSVVLGFIDMAQGMLLAAVAGAQVKGIFSFFTTIAGDFAAIAAATVALQAARALVASAFHVGGVVGPRGERLPLAPDERPIIVRVGETVRTPEQEQRLQNRMRGGASVVINFNGPVSDERWVKRLVEKGLRSTGLTIDQYMVDNSGTVKIR